MKVRVLRLSVLVTFLALYGTAAVRGDAPEDPDAPLQALSDPDRQWLENDVAPIILPVERDVFLELTEPYQREAFRNDFWARREQAGLPFPLGPGYRERYEELRRLVDEKYDGWHNDAGRMVLRWGEPSAILKPDCDRMFRSLEIWTYTNFGGASQGTMRFFFYRPSGLAPRKLWTTDVRQDELFEPGSCRKSLADLAADCQPKPNDPCLVCHDACDVFRAYTEIRARQGGGAGGAVEMATLLAPPAVPTEGLDQQLHEQKARWAATKDPGAKTISVRGPGPQAGDPLSAPSPAPAPSAAAAGRQLLAPLSAKERASRLATLPEEDRKWLEDFVAPIILPPERDLFLRLEEPHQREIFKEDFWSRREQPGLEPPLGPGYRARYEHFRELAATAYDGLASDTGRLVVLRGEPLSVQEYPDCNDVFRQVEVWTYAAARPGSASGKETQFLFYRPSYGSPRKLWYPAIPDREVLGTSSCLTTFSEACRPAGLPASASSDPTCPSLSAPKTCRDACDIVRVAEEIRARGVAEVSMALSEPPKVDTEGLEKLAERFPGLAGTRAAPLIVQGPEGQAMVPASPSAKVTSGEQADSSTPSTPAPARRKLSKKEERQLAEALPQKYRDFLTLTAIIMTDDEREVFLQISENYQRDKFIDAFWRRRSFDSQGLRTDYRAVYTHRVQLALSEFGDVHNDRAKVFVINGPPDAVIPVDCEDVYVPLQIWYYERLETLKSKVYLIFYEPYGMPPYKLWLPIDGRGVLLVGVGSTSVAARTPNIENCFEWRSVEQAIQYSTAVLGSGAFGLQTQSQLFRPPTVETEGVDQILSMTTELHEGAADLPVAKLVRFPEMRANKLGMDLSLLVPKAELKPRALGEESFYNVDIVGEVVKEDRLIDNFKYRFDIPTEEIGGDKIPLTVRRYLYPGTYKLVLKISDGNQNAEGRFTETLTVPEQPDAPPPEVVAARAAGKAAVAQIKDVGLLPSAISLLPVAKEMVTGLQRFETRTSEGVRAVDFYLNGAKIMTRTKAPFEADLNLGPLPRKQTVRVVAYGPTGRSVGEDEYIVNEGREVFRVKILTPEKGARVSGPTKVAAAVATPEGKTLQKLEFYSNESRVATLYQAPYEQTVNLKATGSLGYVRVVGTLDDGTVAEDLRYINAPQFVSEVTVDAVELYTTVTEKGRPVNFLQASNFKVFEDGVPQTIQGFEYVKKLPLSVGILIDSSASMLEALPDAEQAALKFIDFTIGPKDRAFVVSFDNEPYLLSKLTGRKDRLVRSLAGLRAEGSTALYDAIVYGLYQFTGIKGKKALVILTDGKDTASKFDYDTMLEYVRKSGLAIYGIGLKISGTDLEVKYKLNKIAQITGGQTFYIDSAKNLESVYRQINEDLRSQYLLTYYSSNTGARDQWRKVEVKVEPSKLEARTISGYYP
jgi:Ca-activated chloride channel family protein